MGEIDMKRQTPETKPNRKQLGILVDEKLWRKFRAEAITRGLTATAFLEMSMRVMLRKNGEVDSSGKEGG